jgi:DNA-binding CsgD family transcriptional regulator
MLSAADFRSLNEASLALYSPELFTSSFMGQAYEFLNRLVPCDLITYGDLDLAAGSLAATSNHQSPDWATAVEGFGRCMAQYPLFRFDPGVNGGKPFFRNDFYSAREFRELDMYSECFRLIGMNNHAAVHVPVSDGHVRYFALERNSRLNYDERDRLLLDAAQRHLANAWLLAQARGFTARASDPADFSARGFTPRECDVAYWLTLGKSNVEIGVILSISLHTVKAHLTSMFNKTGSGNRLALTMQLMGPPRADSPGGIWHRVHRE